MFRPSLQMGIAAAAAATAFSNHSLTTSYGGTRTPRPIATIAKVDIMDPSFQVEEDVWSDLSLDDEGLYFGRAEIRDTVEEIIGLYDENNEETSSEDGADDTIDTITTSSESKTFMRGVMAVSQKLLHHANVQLATLEAIRDDEELRYMMEELAKCELINCPTSEVIEMDQYRPKRRQKYNPMATLFEDLTIQILRLGSFVKDTSTKAANRLRIVLNWLLGLMKKAGEMVLDHTKENNECLRDSLPAGARFFLSDLGSVGKIAPIVLAGSMMVVVLMIAKRSAP